MTGDPTDRGDEQPPYVGFDAHPDQTRGALPRGLGFALAIVAALALLAVGGMYAVPW